MSEPTGKRCNPCILHDVAMVSAAEVEQLRRELARGEQSFANEQVRRMRDTGFCPCCGAEDGRG